MCTELFLALLYFLTIVIVNYFLYKLLMNFSKKINYLFKIRNIINNFEQKKSITFLTLYNYTNSESKFSLDILNTICSTNDIFLIGNTYRYLSNTLKEDKTLSLRTAYYFELVENQYLSNTVRLK